MTIISGGPRRSDILCIGTVDSNGQPKNWTFSIRDDDPNVPVVDIETVGIVRYSGWSVDELRAIAEGAESP